MRHFFLKDAAYKLLTPPKTTPAGIWFIWRNEPADGYMTAVYYSLYSVREVRLLRPDDKPEEWVERLKKEGYVNSCLRT